MIRDDKGKDQLSLIGVTGSKMSSEYFATARGDAGANAGLSQEE